MLAKKSQQRGPSMSSLQSKQGSRQQYIPSEDQPPNVGLAESAGDQESAVNPIAAVPRTPNVPDSVISLISGQFATVREVSQVYVQTELFQIQNFFHNFLIF